MATNDLPTSDAQIETMLADGTAVPLAAVSYPNWHNKYVTLADDLKSAYREGGVQGLREATLAVADDVCREALDREGMSRDPTPNERLATAVRVIAIPGTTRNAFVRGAVAELLWEDRLSEMGYTILSADEVEDETNVNAYKQERSKGWDVSAKKNGEITHFQIKATADEPDMKKKKDADALIWYEIDDDGAMLAPEEVTA